MWQQVSWVDKAQDCSHVPGEMNHIWVHTSSLELHLSSKKAPVEASPHLIRYPIQRVVRVPGEGTSKKGYCLPNKSSHPLHQGLPNCTWGKRSKKGKGGITARFSPSCQGSRKGGNEEERLFPFKSQLGWQRWEESTAENDCW